MKFLYDLQIWKKFATLGLLAGGAVALLLSLLISEKNEFINFAEKELQGTRYIRPLVQTLEYAIETRNTGLVNAPGHGQALSRLETSFRALESEDQVLEKALETTDADFRERKRDSLKPSALRARWQAVRNIPDLSGQFEEQTKLISALRELVRHVGDTSNLVLDPDADSFYTMFVTINRLPPHLLLSGDMHALVSAIRRRGTITPAERSRLETLAALLEGEAVEIQREQERSFEAAERSSGTQKLETALAPRLKEFLQAHREMIGYVRRMLAADEKDLARSADADPVFSRCNSSSTAYVSAALAELDVLLATRIAGLEKRKWTVVAAVGAVLALAALFVIAMVRQIGRQVRHAVDVANRLASGDLRVEVRVGSKDEIGSVLSSMQSMAETLMNTMKSVGENARSLTGVAAELAEASQSMSTGTEEMAQQAQSIAAGSTQLNQNLEVVSSSVEEMSISVSDIAKRSVDAASVAASAKTKADLANQVVQDLGLHAAQIGKVIDSIVDIADQTNLLALNAAIEAADAGDTGKRFAVVASEVKELARQTAESSEEIRSRIETIQKSVGETVGAIGSITSVIQTIHEVNAAVASFVEEQSIAAQDISRNTTQAASVSNSVAQNVNGVSTVIGTGAKEATRIASMAETLNSMAGDLESTLRRFKT